ncbi:MAG: nicotinate-nucleotide--dimethylbenzimidazole phosphoribosyltransferase [Candidatus Auribacterota bacterium]|nr:nicotinate-nucleotide--dimethylbenzimidazole phosphoribosyltransferase [Candidatus Auribacterota bacterium]
MLKNKKIQEYLDNLTKPPGSLGRLEELAVRLCEIQQTLKLRTSPRLLVVFAADHGVIEEHVTAWPSKVTELMIDNIIAGGAASSVLSDLTDTQLRLVDVGSFAGPRKENMTYRFARIAPGTANLARGPAMTTHQFKQAMAVGAEEISRAVASGVAVVTAGEMGIGNSTPAACLAGLLCDLPAEQVTGRGAGADDAILNQKTSIISEVLERNKSLIKSDILSVIASVSGFEIAAMAGFYIAAAEENLTIVLDGFIATAAALVAETLSPGIRNNMIASHCSAEQGHIKILEKLGLNPLVDWSMRLGEGTGALLVMSMLDAAAAIISKMATFQSAGIKDE